MLAFHGGSGGSGERLRGFIGEELDRLAEELGFVAVYPDGFGGTWNGCRAGATTPANLQEVDVVAVVARLSRTTEWTPSACSRSASPTARTWPSARPSSRRA